MMLLSRAASEVQLLFESLAGLSRGWQGLHAQENFCQHEEHQAWFTLRVAEASSVSTAGTKHHDIVQAHLFLHHCHGYFSTSC